MRTFRLTLLTILAGLTVYYFYPEDKFPNNRTIDKIVVYKSKNKLFTYSGGQLLKTYKISLGRNPVGKKEFEGDKKTPEGLYTINDKNSKSSYHKNLGISYPNQSDIDRAKKIGKSTGGEIKIHGLRNGLGFIGKFQRWTNWTAGCIALTNKEMDELYDHTPIGTVIQILP